MLRNIDNVNVYVETDEVNIGRRSGEPIFAADLFFEENSGMISNCWEEIAEMQV